MKTKIIIADVHSSVTDETYYVLNGLSRFANDYKVNSLREAFIALRNDGWSNCGKVQRSDDTAVNMFQRNNDQIAIWSEIEVIDEEQEEEALIKGLGNLSVNPGEKNFFYKGEPRAKKSPIYRNGNRIYLRNHKISMNALIKANYKCEVNENHPTFIRKYSSVPYTEPHHLVPMEYSDQFEVSLDVEENIISLCSNCHNLLHYGRSAEKIILQLFEERKEVLKLAGIQLSQQELLEMYL